MIAILLIISCYLWYNLMCFGRLFYMALAVTFNWIILLVSIHTHYTANDIALVQLRPSVSTSYTPLVYTAPANFCNPVTL